MSSSQESQLDDPIGTYLKYQDGIDPESEEHLPQCVILARHAFMFNDPKDRESVMHLSYSATHKKLYAASVHVVDPHTSCHYFMTQVHVPENWSDTLMCQYEVSPIMSTAYWDENGGTPKPQWVWEYPVNDVCGEIVTSHIELPYFASWAESRPENRVMRTRIIEWYQNVSPVTDGEGSEDDSC